VLGQPERLAGIYWNDFIYAITEDKSPIQYRDACFFDGHEIPIEINHGGP
jgi:hypothetical protein